MVDKKEAFPGRWSRLKRGGGATPVVQQDDAVEEPVVATLKSDETAPVAALQTDQGSEPQTTDPAPDLPDIDSLDADSDYTPFLGDNVPEQLARKALRKLWLSDASFGFRDGLDDYDENFRAYFTDAVAKTVKTAYRVAQKATEDGDQRVGDYGGASEGEPNSAESADAPETADQDPAEQNSDDDGESEDIA